MTTLLLGTLFAMPKIWLLSFSKSCGSLIRDRLWNCQKVVNMTTFGECPNVILMQKFYW